MNVILHGTLASLAAGAMTAVGGLPDLFGRKSRSGRRMRFSGLLRAKQATAGLTLGLALMMFLDVALG